ncbi:MAG: DUF2029 domain-containing protein, partial [Spirochaetales bacterium]|nr:DUF2029 domain-containing protein [Spirochaetales bacterium]
MTLPPKKTVLIILIGYILLSLAAGAALFLLTIVSGSAAEDVIVTVETARLPEEPFLFRKSLRVDQVFSDFSLVSENRFIQLKKYAAALEIRLSPEELEDFSSLTVSIGEKDFIFTSEDIAAWERDEKPEGLLYVAPRSMRTHSSSLTRFSPFFGEIINYPVESHILLSSFVKAFLLVLIGPFFLWGFFLMGDKLFDGRKVRIPFGFLLYLLVMVFAISFLAAPGIHDVHDSWLHGWWMDSYERLGPVRGYADAGDNYPPLSFVFIGLMREVADHLGADVFYVYKISIMAFLIWMSLIVRRISGDWIYPAVFTLALLLATVSHGYTDYMFAPFLMISLLQLKKENYLAAGLVFTAGLLLKWQPLMVMPYILIYLINVNRIKDIPRADWKMILLKIVLPFMLIFLVSLAVWGPHLVASLLKGMSHSALSFFGMNGSWVLSFFLHLADPEKYGAAKGFLGYIYAEGLAVKLFGLIFPALYLFSLYRFFRKEKKGWDDLVRFMIIGYLAYFLFNKGVHQNHLFLVPVLIPLLFNKEGGGRERKENLIHFFFWSLVMNANLYYFYGVDGDRQGIVPRLFLGYDVYPLILASGAIIYFLFWYVKIISWDEEN